MIGHVDTGPLWYQWIARAGHHAWLWYGADGVTGAERLVRETSPDVVLVDAASATDPGWIQVQELRRRFAHAGHRVVVIGEHAESVAAPYVHAVTSVDSAEALLAAVEAALASGR